MSEKRDRRCRRPLDATRTRIWYEWLQVAITYAPDAEGKRTREFLRGQRKFPNYRDGVATPNPCTLAQIDALLPGSMAIFESALWQILENEVVDVENLKGKMVGLNAGREEPLSFATLEARLVHAELARVEARDRDFEAALNELDALTCLLNRVPQLAGDRDGFAVAWLACLARYRQELAEGVDGRTRQRSDRIVLGVAHAPLSYQQSVAVTFKPDIAPLPVAHEDSKIFPVDSRVEFACYFVCACTALSNTVFTPEVSSALIGMLMFLLHASCAVLPSARRWTVATGIFPRGNRLKPRDLR